MKLNRIMLMYVASFVAMLISMYAMVAVWGHVYLNINKIYMALLMVATMGVVNVLIMRGMFETDLWRWGSLLISMSLSLVLLLLIRGQIFIGNKSFLRSMIPHHSSAILMCEQASITDSEIADLCEDIVKTQKREIELMKVMLEKY